jgi:hypothetical protein
MPLGREAIHPLTYRAVYNATNVGKDDRGYIRDELRFDLEAAGLSKAAVQKNLDTFGRLVRSAQKSLTTGETKMAAAKKPAKRKSTKRNPGLAKGQSLMQKAASAYRAGKYRTMQAALKGESKK